MTVLVSRRDSFEFEGNRNFCCWPEPKLTKQVNAAEVEPHGLLPDHLRVLLEQLEMLSGKSRSKPMPLQNRVSPFGDIVSVSARGTYMGNRGIIHDAKTKTLLTRRWKHQV